jgi:hypothetical protein
VFERNGDVSMQGMESAHAPNVTSGVTVLHICINAGMTM